MADDQQLSPEEYKQLQDIAAQLPTGHPAQAKVAALLASQPTQFEKQKTAEANAEGPVSRFARGALRTAALPESVSDIPRWASWLTGQQPGQEPWWQPQVNAYKNPTQENLVGAVPFVGPPSVAASRDVRSNNYAGALGDLASLPLSVRGGMEVRPGVSALKTSLAENLRAPDNTLTPSARLVGAGTGAAAGAVLTPTHPYLGASVGGSLGGGLADFLVPERASAFKSSYPGYYSDFADVAPGAFELRSASPVPKPLFSKLPNRIPPAVRGDPFAPPTVSAEPIESPGASLPSASDFYANEGALRMQLLKQAAQRGDTNPMNPFAPQPKTSQPSSIVTPSGGARPRVGSEGRAATWTNERVQQLAAEGNREAIQQATLRGLELPPNARYVMGDPNYSDVTYNPRDVTTFTPEGTPIRQSTKGIQRVPQGKATPFAQPTVQPYTITNEMGIRWANTPGLPKISIPNGMAEADIPSYVAEKQALQKKGVSELFQ